MIDEKIHLEHALLDVGDMERSLAFYRKLLPSWTVRGEGPAERGARWIHFGPPGEGQPGYLSLYEIRGARPAGEDGEAVVRIEHVGFAHPDVRALAERLAPAGIRPTDEADDGRYRRLYFEDPDGHVLEFVQKLQAT